MPKRSSVQATREQRQERGSGRNIRECFPCPLWTFALMSSCVARAKSSLSQSNVNGWMHGENLRGIKSLPRQIICRSRNCVVYHPWMKQTIKTVHRARFKYNYFNYFQFARKKHLLRKMWHCVSTYWFHISHLYATGMQSQRVMLLLQGMKWHCWHSAQNRDLSCIDCHWKEGRTNSRRCFSPVKI